MSAVHAQSLPARRRAPETPRRLRTAPDRAGARAKPRLAYAVIAIGGIVTIVVAQLLLSITIAQGAYEIDTYQVAQAGLARQEQKLSEDLDRVESPQFLAKSAEALGMVPNANPVFLQLSDGAVRGEPTAARGGAAASALLVPNVLIDGVPLVTDQPPGQTPSGGVPGQPGETAGTAPVAAPPTVDGGLPTPATH